MSGRSAAALALAVAAAACGCGPPAPKSVAERTVVDRARGVRYVVPRGWKSFDAEMRSPEGSLLSFKVHELTGADPKFVAGLPDIVFPQLLDSTKWYYLVDGEPTRTETTVDGAPTTELTYPVRIQKGGPPTKVVYWLIRHGTRLYLLRATFPPSGLAQDEPEVRKILASWSFLETPPPSPPPSPSPSPG